MKYQNKVSKQWCKQPSILKHALANIFSKGSSNEYLSFQAMGPLLQLHHTKTNLQMVNL